MKEHSSQLSPFFVSSIVALSSAITLVVMDDWILESSFVSPVVFEVTCKLFVGLSLITFVGYGLLSQLYDQPRPFRPVAMLIYGILLYLLFGLSMTFQAASILFAMGFLSFCFASLFTSR